MKTHLGVSLWILRKDVISPEQFQNSKEMVRFAQSKKDDTLTLVPVVNCAASI